MRIQKLEAKLKEHKIDQCIISDPSSILYFTGHHFSVGERMLVLLVQPQHKPILFLNQLFPCDEIENIDILRFDDTDPYLTLLCNHLLGKTIAVDKNWPSGFLLSCMEILKDKDFVKGSNYVDEIRAIKDFEEQAKMRKASLINDSIMCEVRKRIRVGVSEEELEKEVITLFETKSEGISFDPIIAFKKNAADPHGSAGKRILSVGDAVIIDMGCMYEGYCADMTRTFFVGHNGMSEVYDLVLQANLAAEQLIKPGVTFKQIDQAAREVITQGGYGEYFIHRTGHGIGMDVHEPYDVSQSNEIIVQEGMCFSIEPGIYLPGVGGVRIEDVIIVTQNGCEVLNHFPKDQPVIV